MSGAGLKKRRDTAWGIKGAWNKLTKDAYDFAIPNRQPAANIGQGNSRTVRLHDATAANLVFASASQLRDDIAPPGQPLARLRASRLLRKRLSEKGDQGKEQLEAIKAQHEETSDVVNSMFLGGGFSSALLECCIDAHVSTGALLMLEGNVFQPARFAAIPIDQLAIEVDMFGHETLMDWKQKLTRRNIKDTFPNANYTKEWRDAFEEQADKEQELSQCFVRRPSGMAWDLFVFLDSEETPILKRVFKTCPIIPMPFQRVPGEPYGRGPILTLLPTIKVLNAATELQLKAYSIQMLGLWMYRKGGSFNPDTAQIAPGAFWKVDNTGGMFGPDIARLDPATGRLDIGAQLSTELRAQISSGLQRQQLPTDGASPRSATEYMVRDKENVRQYRGAYGRMVEEFVPKLFWRGVEIAWNLGLTRGKDKISFDQMLMQLDVLSPLAAAMRAQQFEPALHYQQYLMQTNQDPDEWMDRDALNETMSFETGVLTEFTRTKEQRIQYRKERDARAAAAMAAQAAAQAAAKQPPPAPTPPGVAA